MDNGEGHKNAKCPEGVKELPVQYKVNILAELKTAGYNTTRLRRERLLAESTIQQIRGGELVSWANISRICSMLNCQPGDILEHIPENAVATAQEAASEA